VLDRLNASPSPHAIVRDARWLIQTAQGPLTRHLRPYFTIAEHIAESLSESDRLAVHRAGATLAGGHLRSQLRYAMWNSQRPADDADVLAFTRNSNSMDNGLLVRDLVPLLEAYRTARANDNVERRLELADPILQGLSADPGLLLVRLDLLRPYTMIEDLFIERDAEGRLRYTPMCERHLGVLESYSRLIGQLAESLLDDAPAFDPARGAYSPFGIVHGFCADLMSNMAMTTLLARPARDLTLEDTFVSRDRLEDKLARARDWKALPTREGER
jgi:hypothetical protein